MNVKKQLTEQSSESKLKLKRENIKLDRSDRKLAHEELIPELKAVEILELSDKKQSPKAIEQPKQSAEKPKLVTSSEPEIVEIIKEALKSSSKQSENSKISKSPISIKDTTIQLSNQKLKLTSPIASPPLTQSIVLKSEHNSASKLILDIESDDKLNGVLSPPPQINLKRVKATKNVRNNSKQILCNANLNNFVIILLYRRSKMKAKL